MSEPVHIGIPAYCERENLPSTLEALSLQDTHHFEVWVCVNQPETWLHNPAFDEITRQNKETLNWLRTQKGAYPFRLHILDAVEEHPLPEGVGQARRFLFDEIYAKAPHSEVFISLDADTRAALTYVSCVREAFQRYPNAGGLATPLYHPLPQDPNHALHLLRYELYMRYFQLSLWRIQSPYAYLAIGSAMAFRPESYKRVGGMPRRRAGEDFYFMQQLRKTGPVIRWIPSKVYPSSRASDRVPFGTGPLMLERDLKLQEGRFPFYDQGFFDRLKASFQMFPKLFESSIQLPIHHFLTERLGGYHAFEKMRRNYARPCQFIKACHERIDGLRTLQYLRFSEENEGPSPDPQTSVNQLLALMGKPPIKMVLSPEHIAELDHVRNLLVGYEAECQKAFMDVWDFKARW